MARDDDRLANASRALRSYKRLTQDKVVGHGRSRHVPRLIEDGRAGELRLHDVREHFRKLGASLRVTAWFEGALLDRLIDSEHADVVEAAVREIRRTNWPVVEAEVSFNQWGERGSIDFLAADEARGAVLVGEAKSAWGSVEETLRRLDVKVRVAPAVTADRHRWKPRLVGAVLLLPESGSSRRIAQRFAATMLVTFPARNRDINKWLRAPAGPLRGLWFLPIGRRSDRP